MKVFLVFEASSLSDHSYPVEVAWVFQDGRSESHLIRPATGWTDWDDEAEAIHGITREKLASEGEPHADVATHMVEVSCPLLSGPSITIVWTKEGVTYASEEAQGRGDHWKAA